MKSDKQKILVEFTIEELELLNELADMDNRSRKSYVEQIVKNHLKKIKTTLTNGK